MISHPQTVHFPVVLFLVAMSIEIISYFYKKELMSRQSLIFLILSCIGTYLALKTGEGAAESVKLIPGIQSSLEIHQNAGEIFLYVLLFITVVKVFIITIKKDIVPWRILILLAMLAVTFQLYRTAHFGGQLVYEWGAGVKPVMISIPKSAPSDSISTSNLHSDESQ